MEDLNDNQDTVELNDLQGEALAAALAKAQASETGEDTASTLGSKDNGEAEPIAQGEADTVSGEANADSQANSAADVQDTTVKAEGETEVDKLKRTLTEKEKFNQRLATEMGELRKQLLAMQRANLPNIDPNKWQETFEANPMAALAEAQEVERKRQEFALQEAQIVRTNTEQVVKQFIPDFEELKTHIVELAKQDGVRQEHINAFLSDPYGTSDANTLIGYANRAKLIAERDRYKTELESVKQKTQSVGKKIESAAKATPAMPNTAGGSTTVKAPVSEAQILAMTPEQRNKLLAELIAEEGVTT